MRLSKAIAGFFLSKSADGLSPNTIGIYRWALDKLVAFLDDPDLDSVSADDLRRWFVFLRTEYVTHGPSRNGGHLAIGSLQNAWVAVKSLWHWAHDELGVSRVADSLKRPQGEPPIITPFTETEIRALLKAAETTTTKGTHKRRSYYQVRHTAHRNAALIRFLLDTGARVSEVARLRISDVSLELGEVVISPFGSGRKSKGRHVYIGKSTRRELWRYLADRDDVNPEDCLFVSQDDQPMDKYSIGLVLRRIGRRAGVAHVHAHRFRHTFAVEYLRGGGDVFTLKRLLGHATLEMVNRYLALANTDDAAAHRRASPVDRWRL
jgi:integrase/recombinase XerD